MIVSDIKQDVKDIIGMCPDDTLYNRLTHAIEVLANKGQWDSLTMYLDILTPSRIITLPKDVETPIKINIDNNPSFSRGQLYEFSINGPRNDMQETAGWSWMNKGTVAVLAQPASNKVNAVSSNNADDGKQIYIEGRDINNQPVKDVLTLSHTSPPVSASSYKSIDRVHKDDTLGIVTLHDNVTTNVLAEYDTAEPNPEYRQILLNRDAKAVKILFRRKTNKITSDNDFIPLQSAMALLMMLFSLEEFRKGTDFQKAQAYESQALKFLQEEQTSRNNFDLTKNTELQNVLDLNYNNADSIIAADIYDDAASIFGMVSRQSLFDRISDAIELLSNKGHWDGLVGYVDIMSHGGQVTLPRYVDSILALNICGHPAEMRSKWYEFHLNGWGSGTTPCRYWDNIGSDYPTFAPLRFTAQLIAQPDLDADDGKTLTVYGRDDQGRELGTVVDDKFVKGLTLTLDHLGPQPASDAIKVSYIERIVKDPTSGYVQLQAFNPLGGMATQIGYYHPDETDPKYTRIQLPLGCAWVRMRYKKRTLRISSLTEPLHLRSKLALTAAMRAINALRSGDLQSSSSFETLAVQYLEEDQIAHNPGEVVNFQVSGFGRNGRVII